MLEVFRDCLWTRVTFSLQLDAEQRCYFGLFSFQPFLFISFLSSLVLPFLLACIVYGICRLCIVFLM